MLCTACGTDTPAPFDTCRQCATPLPRPASAASNAETLNPASVSSSPASGHSLQIGETFGRYRILKLLGAGGMGQVYHAWDEELSEAVALKVIRSEFAGNAEADARFKRELSVARQVTHTNVVRIHDLGVIDGVRFISMPFIEGLDLAAIASAGRLPQDLALSVARQLAAGLAAAHAAGVVHRDLKPANVMVDHSGHVFLMDFGLARSVEVTQLTQTGMLIGTVEYMSPEQAMGETADHRSDVYTLGLILFELFTGKRPFAGETAMSRLTARLHKSPPDPRALQADVPAYLSRIILRCLERDIERRYQKVDDLIADLDEGEGHPVRRRRAARWDRGLGRRLASNRALAALVVVLALAVAGGYFAWRHAPQMARRGAAVAATNSVGVVPFQNASGDPTLDWVGTSVAEMLSGGIGRTASIRTVSSGRLTQVLTDLHVSGAAVLEAPTLQRVAQFSNADTLVWGRYARTGDQLRIEAFVQDVRTARTVALEPVTAPPRQLLAAVDALVRALQQQLAHSPDEMAQMRATALRPTSNSVDALRAYNEGLGFARQGDFRQAEAKFQDATSRDPNFALAYSHLALTLSTLGRDDAAEQASRRAMALSAALPGPEQYRVRANHARVLHDNQKAIEAYEELGRVSPGDPDVEFALAGLNEDNGALDKAREGYRRVLAHDPRYVDALLAAGRVEIKQGKPQDGIEFLNRGLSLAIAIDNDEEKGRLLHAIGIAYARLNKPEESLRYYQEALVVRRKVGQQGGIAATISQIAEAERTLGRPREALASYNEALRIQREIGDKRSLAANLLNLASFRADRGENDESLRIFKESLQLHRDLGDQGGQALCLNNVGSVYFAEGQYADALTYFQQALQLRQPLNVPGDIAETLHNVAETSAKMGQYDEALSQYMRALDLYRGAGNKQGAAIESFGMGKMFEAQGRYGAALTAKSEALKAFRAIGERGYWMAHILAGYGVTLAALGRTAEAGQNLDEALSVAKTLDNAALIALILNNRGEAAWYAGDLRRASGLFEQALAEASRARDREQVLMSRFNVAFIAVKEGREAAAIPALKAVSSEASAAGLRYLSARCALTLGEALLARHRDAEAKAELESALSRSEKMGLGSLLADNHYLLARAHHALRQDADAAAHMTSARSALEAIRKESGNDDVLKRPDFTAILTNNPLEGTRTASVVK